MNHATTFAPALALTLLTALLTGCTGATPEDKMGSFLVAPGKYDLYDCTQLAAQYKETGEREKELQGLLARAQAGGSKLVGDIAYQPEYLSLHGQMNEMRTAAVEKKCGPLPEAGAPVAPVRPPAR